MAQNEEAQKVTARPVPWFEGAREMIARADPGGPEVLDHIEQEIKANRLTLFEVRDEWELIGIFSARWAIQYNGERHLLIIHGVALKEEEGFSLMVAMKEPIRSIAKQCGCSRVEVHTRRRGMERLIERNGYEFQETIFSIGV